MKIYAARKIGYDAEGLRRAVEYLCQTICDDMGLAGYEIVKYGDAVASRGSIKLDISVLFDGAYSIYYGKLGEPIKLSLRAPVNTKIAYSYFTDNGYASHVESNLTTERPESYQAKYEADFELFVSELNKRAREAGLKFECRRAANTEMWRTVHGLFYIDFISAEGPHAPYQCSNNFIESVSNSNIDEYVDCSNWITWTPYCTELSLADDAQNIVDCYRSALNKLNAKTDQINEGSYSTLCKTIAEQLNSSFPQLQITPQLDWWHINDATSTGRAAFSLVYNGEKLTDLEVDDVYHVDMNKLIKNMKRRLQRVDQRRAEESTGFTYL